MTKPSAGQEFLLAYIAWKIKKDAKESAQAREQAEAVVKPMAVEPSQEQTPTTE